MDFIDLYRKNISNIKVLVIGDVMIDAYLWGKVDRISPEAPVPVVAVHKRENRLGGAANVALNILSLGAKPILMGVLGQDEKGHEFLKIMEEHGLSTEAMILASNRITTTKFRILGNNTQMLRVDEEETTALTDELALEFFVKAKALIDGGNIEAVIFEDYDKGMLDSSLINRIITYAGEKQIPICVDPKKRNFFHYGGSTLFKPNLKEFLEGTNSVYTEDISQLKNKMESFRKEHKLSIVMLTMAEKGVVISYQEDGQDFFKQIPAKVRNVADVSGAGDTVISVAAIALALGVPAPIMAEIANLAGGIVCEYVGVVPINPERLLDEATKWK